jgi:hypothetical protein
VRVVWRYVQKMEVDGICSGYYSMIFSGISGKEPIVSTIPKSVVYSIYCGDENASSSVSDIHHYVI